MAAAAAAFASTAAFDFSGVVRFNSEDDAEDARGCRRADALLLGDRGGFRARRDVGLLLLETRPLRRLPRGTSLGLHPRVSGVRLLHRVVLARRFFVPSELGERHRTPVPSLGVVWVDGERGGGVGEGVDVIAEF